MVDPLPDPLSGSDLYVRVALMPVCPICGWQRIEDPGYATCPICRWHFRGHRDWESEEAFWADVLGCRQRLARFLGPHLHHRTTDTAPLWTYLLDLLGADTPLRYPLVPRNERKGG